MISDKEVDIFLKEYSEKSFYNKNLTLDYNGPGIYLFLTKDTKKIIYVGKSINIKKRVNSYHHVCKKLSKLKMDFLVKVYIINSNYLSLEMAESLILNHLIYNLGFFPVYNNEA